MTITTDLGCPCSDSQYDTDHIHENLELCCEPKESRETDGGQLVGRDLSGNIDGLCVGSGDVGGILLARVAAGEVLLVGRGDDGGGFLVVGHVEDKDGEWERASQGELYI